MVRLFGEVLVEVTVGLAVVVVGVLRLVAADTLVGVSAVDVASLVISCWVSCALAILFILTSTVVHRHRFGKG